MPGLTGRRTFTSATGTITLDGSNGGGGDGGIDELSFEPRPARYVRMQGRAAANQYGYSLWTISVLDTAGADLAQGALVGASSSDVTYPAVQRHGRQPGDPMGGRPYAARAARTAGWPSTSAPR